MVTALKSSFPSDVESASDAANRIIMINFNGLQQWNSKSASLTELISLATITDHGPVAITAAYQVLKEHLENPYQPVVESPLLPLPLGQRFYSTPDSAILGAPPAILAASTDILEASPAILEAPSSISARVNYDSGHECDDIETSDESGVE